MMNDNDLYVSQIMDRSSGHSEEAQSKTGSQPKQEATTTTSAVEPPTESLENWQHL